MLSLDDVLAPAEGVLSQQGGDELVVVLPGAGRFVVLNRTGAHVFRLLDGERTLEDVAAALSRSYDVPLEQARKDVLAFAGKLLERGAVVKSSSEEG